MEETFRLGRIAGIRVGVNWSVLVIFALIAYGLAGQYLPRVYPREGRARVAGRRQHCPGRVQRSPGCAAGRRTATACDGVVADQRPPQGHRRGKPGGPPVCISHGVYTRGKRQMGQPCQRSAERFHSAG
jgi:hypothetical protein